MVDLLLQWSDVLIAIEVKARDLLDSAAFAGLNAVEELPNVVRLILVNLGEHRYRHEAGIGVLPS